MRPAWRRRGIARALLAASMRSYAEAGLDAAGLGVDTENPTGAYGLYAEMGFVATNTTVLYARTETLEECPRRSTTRRGVDRRIRIAAMSGHSKWATTKHKKAVVDARRGKLFAKLIKNVEVAARIGGGDPAGNPTLYDAIQKAKKSSVPNDNIDRAVKRGSGAEGGGADYETLMYEAYGPAGVALLIECLTDNRNRSASDVRVAVTRNGGTMADAGSVQRMFSRKGVVTLPKEQGGRTLTEDDVLEATLDADPEEVNDLGDSFEIVSDPSDTVRVRTAAQEAGLDYDSAEVEFVPDYTQEIDAPTAERLFRIIEALEDSDDVQNVYANFDASDEVLAAVG